MWWEATDLVIGHPSVAFGSARPLKLRFGVDHPLLRVLRGDVGGIFREELRVVWERHVVAARRKGWSEEEGGRRRVLQR